MSAFKPPRWADELLVKLCPSDLLEEIQGDLHEAFHWRCNQKNASYARRKFLLEVLLVSRFYKPKILKNSIFTTMFKNNFKVAFRSLLKNRLYSFINISGLAVGLAAFLMIIQYVAYEQSYENFIEEGKNIYRVQLDVYNNGALIYKSSENYPGVGQALKAEFPEVIEAAKLFNIGSKNNVNITSENGEETPKVLKQTKVFYSEPSFLSMFSNTLIHGDIHTALEKPFTMAISESTAQKYFGDENPIGKLLRFEDDDFNNELCEITAVFKDVPHNTHLKYDVLISFSTIFARGSYATTRYGTGWERKNFYTYLQLKKGTDIAQLES